MRRSQANLSSVSAPRVVPGRMRTIIVTGAEPADLRRVGSGSRRWCLSGFQLVFDRFDSPAAPESAGLKPYSTIDA